MRYRAKVLMILMGFGMIVFGAGTSGLAAEYPQEAKIGAIFCMSGPGAVYGTTMKNGAELAVDHVNQDGGLGGKIVVKLIVEDHAGKPAMGVNAMNKLINIDKVPFVLSSYTSVTLSIIPFAEKAKVTVVNGGGQGNELSGCSPFVFNDLPVVGNEIRIMAKFAYEQLGKTSAILADTTEAGLSFTEAWKEQFTKLGGKVIETLTAPYGTTDYRSRLIKIKAANPAVVYPAGLHARDARIFLQQLKEMGIKAVPVGTATTVGGGTMADPAAVGMYHTMLAWNPKGNFVEAYKKKYGSNPDMYAANMYNGVVILNEATRVILKNNWEFNGDSIRKAIEKTRDFEGVNGPIKFGNDNVAKTDINICIIEEGGKDKIIETIPVSKQD